MRGGHRIGIGVLVRFDARKFRRVCVRLGYVLLTTPHMEKEDSGSVDTHVGAEH